MSSWLAPVGTLVELVGGRLDGAVLHLPPGPLPEHLGVVEGSRGQLMPVRSATARLLIARERRHGALYEPTTPSRSGRARYALVPSLPPATLDELLDEPES